MSDMLRKVRLLGDRPSVCNLIYYIYPYAVDDGRMWRWNVEQLRKYIRQFNGTRSIAIATDDKSASVADVKAAFGSERIDNWIYCENDVRYGEWVGFVPLLKTLPRSPGNVTFYGHARSVTHSWQSPAHRYTQLLYEINLGYPTIVLNKLHEYILCGAFMRTGSEACFFADIVSGCWYPGTFFWFRNALVLTNAASFSNSRLYRSDAVLRIRDNPFAHFKRCGRLGAAYGVELWPGVNVRCQHACDLVAGWLDALADAGVHSDLGCPYYNASVAVMEQYWHQLQEQTYGYPRSTDC